MRRFGAMPTKFDSMFDHSGDASSTPFGVLCQPWRRTDVAVVSVDFARQNVGVSHIMARLEA